MSRPASRASHDAEDSHPLRRSPPDRWPQLVRRSLSSSEQRTRSTPNPSPPPPRATPDLTRTLTQLAVLVSLALPAAAQYTSPGAGLETALSRKESLESGWSEARWRLGAVHVEPWIGLRDVAYVDVVDANAQGVNEDLTATVGAGLTAYLRLGDSFLAAKALPEYSWWKDLADRRRVIGTYGVGWFGFLSRAEIEITGERREDLAYPSIELLDRVPQTADRLGAKAKIEISGKLGTFLEVAREDLSFDPDDGTGELGSLTPTLDRQSDFRRAGVTFGDERWSIGVGIQDEETTFDAPINDRSNEGTSWLVRLEGKGNRLGFSIDYTERSLEPSGPESTFEPVDVPTGEAVITVKAGWRTEWRLYASQSIVYTLASQGASTEDQRTGLGFTIDLGERSKLSGYYEQGRNRFQPLGDQRREDDLTAYGGYYAMTLGRGLALRLGASRMEIDSPVAGQDREVTAIQAGVSFGAGANTW